MIVSIELQKLIFPQERNSLKRDEFDKSSTAEGMGFNCHFL